MTRYLLVMALFGCASTPAQKAAEANATYKTDHRECVAKAKTLQESKMCRAEVRETWHVDGGGR